MDKAQVGYDMAGIAQILMLLAIFVVFYIFLIRPQNKREKDRKAMVSAIRRGDKVVTTGGIIGQVHRVTNDSEIVLEIDEGVRIRILRDAISSVLSKSDPIASDDQSKSQDSSGEKKIEVIEGAAAKDKPISKQLAKKEKAPIKLKKSSEEPKN